MPAAPSEQSHFVYRLIPPRPTFATDMNDSEAATMQEHVAYWSARMDEGRVLVFGPVNGPEGFWGIGIVVADSEDAARALADADPAITSDLATYAIEPMPSVIVPSV